MVSDVCPRMHSTFAIVVMASMILAAGCGERPHFDARIEQEARQMTDLSEVNPAVAEFIEQIRTEKSLGLPESDFPELWATADSIEPLASGNGTWYV